MLQLVQAQLEETVRVLQGQVNAAYCGPFEAQRSLCPRYGGNLPDIHGGQREREVRRVERDSLGTRQ